jgi:hypothetical protein
MENFSENINPVQSKKRVKLFPMFEDDKVYDMVILYSGKKKVSPYEFIIESIRWYIAKEMKSENINLNTNLNTNEIHSIIIRVAKKRNRAMMSSVEACVTEYIIEVNKEFMPKLK